MSTAHDSTNGFTVADAIAGLRSGDFSRLAPLFGPATDDADDAAAVPIIDWCASGAFDAAPDALAEALTCASFLGRTRVIAYLLDRGVDVAAGRATGLDALHWAVNRGQLAAVRLLVERGAPLETRSRYGGTALGTAAWSAVHEPRAGHLAVIALLLEAGAKADAVERPTGNAAVDALLARHQP